MRPPGQMPLRSGPLPPHPAEAHNIELHPPDLPDAESAAPFLAFNRRRAVERAWEEEARAKPGGWHRLGQGEGRRYWADGQVEIASGGTRGKTMHDVAAAGDVAAIDRRIGRGEHPDQADFLAQTPLMLAAVRGRGDALAALLCGGADINVVDVHGRSVMHHAAGKP